MKNVEIIIFLQHKHDVIWEPVLLMGRIVLFNIIFIIIFILSNGADHFYFH